MKKKPIYLYVLLGLSTVGTLWGLFGKFTSSDAGVKSILNQQNPSMQLILARVQKWRIR